MGSGVGLGSGGTEGNDTGAAPVTVRICEFEPGKAGPWAGEVTEVRPRSACVSWAGADELLTRIEAVTTPATTTTPACAA
jgi:hypothetical protein